MRRPATGSPEFGKANFYGAGKTGFTEGTPGVEAATVVTDDTLNHVVGELANAIEVFGGTALNAAKYDQLSDVLSAISVRGSVRAFHQQIRDAYLKQSTSLLGSFVANDVSWIIGTGLVAVGTSGGVAGIRISSNDGSSWSTLAPASGYTGILYVVTGFMSSAGGTLAGGFIAGSAGEIQFLANGTTVTRQKTGGADIHTLIANANKTQWLAFDSAGRVWRKPYSSGTTWTDGGAVLHATDLRDVCAGYVGTTPYLCAIEGVTIKRSTDDGATWSSVAKPAATVSLYRVVYTGVKGFEWVLSADGNPTTASGAYYSSDLITWTVLTGFNWACRFIAPIPGGVMGIDYQGPYFLATSDGKETLGIYPLAGFDNTGNIRYPKRPLKYLCKPAGGGAVSDQPGYVAYLARANPVASTLMLTKMAALEAPPTGVET